MHTFQVPNSTNITHIAWHDDAIYVRFLKTGAVYKYPGAPLAEYEAFIASTSHGTYLHAQIKHRYMGAPASAQEVAALNFNSTPESSGVKSSV